MSDLPASPVPAADPATGKQRRVAALLELDLEWFERAGGNAEAVVDAILNEVGIDRLEADLAAAVAKIQAVEAENERLQGLLPRCRGVVRFTSLISAPCALPVGHDGPHLRAALTSGGGDGFRESGSGTHNAASRDQP